MKDKLTMLREVNLESISQRGLFFINPNENSKHEALCAIDNILHKLYRQEYITLDEYKEMYFNESNFYSIQLRLLEDEDGI